MGFTNDVFLKRGHLPSDSPKLMTERDRVSSVAPSACVDASLHRPDKGPRVEAVRVLPRGPLGCGGQKTAATQLTYADIGVNGLY
jgi:hypothetical protein